MEDAAVVSGFFGNLVENAGFYFTIASSVVGTFAMIATVTPNKTDDKVAQLILDVINFLAGNFGKAVNHPKVGVNKSAPSDD